MNNPISKCVVAAVALAIGSLANAAPFSVTYTDTVSGRDNLTDINVGEKAQVTLVLDNGGSSAASQTWTTEDVQCIIFTFNNASNKFLAINYGGASFPITTGKFTTDGSGDLQAGTIDWADDSDGITQPIATNIADVDSVGNWFLDGMNDYVVEPGGPGGGGLITFTNMDNDATVTNWSNPVSANGVCASFFAPKVHPARVPVPASSPWSLIVLSALVGLAGLLGLRRYLR